MTVLRHEVAPTGNGGWQVSAGEPEAFSYFGTQREAIRAARAALSALGGGELVVRGLDGRVQSIGMVGRGNYPFSS